MVPTPITLPFRSPHTSMVSCKVPYEQLTEEGEMSLVYIFCVICKQHPRVDKCSTAAHFWDIPEGSGDRKSAQWILSSVPSCLFCLEREMSSCVIHDPWPVVWLDDQGLGMNTIGKLVTKTFGQSIFLVQLRKWNDWILRKNSCLLWVFICNSEFDIVQES